jgi:hypothetical protein
MKIFILLIIIISCGRHHHGTPLSIEDSDGDQVLNYEESQGNKLITQIVPSNAIQGHLRISGDKIYDIEIANALTEDIGFGFISSPQNFNKGNEHFSEYANLKLKTPVDTNSLNGSFYKLNFYFDQALNISHLLLEGNNVHLNIQRSEEGLMINLRKDILLMLLNNEIHLKLPIDFKHEFVTNSEVEDSLRNKTYRVIVSSDGKNEIFYVSHQMTIAEFLSIQKIEEAFSLDDQNTFDFSKYENSKWFYKKDELGNYYVTHHFPQAIFEKYISYYDQTHFDLRRINGKANDHLTVLNPLMMPIFIKYKSYHQVQRYFNDEQRTIRHVKNEGGGGGIHGGGPSKSFSTCHYVIRSISREEVTAKPKEVILENLLHGPFGTQQNLPYSDPEKGTAQLFHFIPEGLKSVSLKFQDLTPDYFLPFGQIQIQCTDFTENIAPLSWVSQEASMSIQGTVYTRKN